MKTTENENRASEWDEWNDDLTDAEWDAICAREMERRRLVGIENEKIKAAILSKLSPEDVAWLRAHVFGRGQ